MRTTPPGVCIRGFLTKLVLLRTVQPMTCYYKVLLKLVQCSKAWWNRGIEVIIAPSGKGGRLWLAAVGSAYPGARVLSRMVLGRHTRNSSWLAAENLPPGNARFRMCFVMVVRTEYTLSYYPWHTWVGIGISGLISALVAVTCKARTT